MLTLMYPRRCAFVGSVDQWSPGGAEQRRAQGRAARSAEHELQRSVSRGHALRLGFRAGLWLSLTEFHVHVDPRRPGLAKKLGKEAWMRQKVMQRNGYAPKPVAPEPRAGASRAKAERKGKGASE